MANITKLKADITIIMGNSHILRAPAITQSNTDRNIVIINN